MSDLVLPALRNDTHATIQTKKKNHQSYTNQKKPVWRNGVVSGDFKRYSQKFKELC